MVEFILDSENKVAKEKMFVPSISPSISNCLQILSIITMVIKT